MAKILIDIDDKIFGRIFHRDCIGEEYDYEVTRAIVNGTKLPDNATNGDVIKTVFPNISKYNNMLLENHSTNILFDDEWWNSPYKVGDINDKL